MAKVTNLDGSGRRGKMNKKSNVVHRIRNGKEHAYTINAGYIDDPSAAQKLQRSVFGKTNAIVNRIMADPEQYRDWEAKMEEYNRSIKPYEPPFPQRFTTVRSYAYYAISEELKRKPAAKRRRAALPLTLPRGVRFQAKNFADLTTAELYEILKARFAVFVSEQHIHYLDEDNIDYIATHFTLRQKGQVLAYARLFGDAEKNVLRIGRMLTIERKKGFGRYLMVRMMDFARTQGAHTIRLHAQIQTVPFYQNLGFHTTGEPFIEAEIPHVNMEIAL